MDAFLYVVTARKLYKNVIIRKAHKQKVLMKLSCLF